MKLLKSVTVAVIVLALASTAAAQFGRRGFRTQRVPLATPEDFDGRFHYCRAAYSPNPRGDGAGWLTDYPSADVNLSIRASELTKMSVAFDESGYPQHLVVRLSEGEDPRYFYQVSIDGYAVGTNGLVYVMTH